MLAKVADVQKVINTYDDNIQAETDVLTMLILGVSALAETHCKRGLTYAQRAEYFDGDGTGRIRLPAYKIWTLDEVLDGSTDAPATSDITSSCRFDADSGILLFPDGIFTKGEKNVKVTWTAGWDEDESGKEPPRDLWLAIVNEVVAILHAHQDEPLPAEARDPMPRVTVLSDKAKSELVGYRRQGYP